MRHLKRKDCWGPCKCRHMEKNEAWVGATLAETGSKISTVWPRGLFFLTHLNTVKGWGKVSRWQLSQQSFRHGYIETPLHLWGTVAPVNFTIRMGFYSLGNNAHSKEEGFVISLRMDSINRGHKVPGTSTLRKRQSSELGHKQCSGIRVFRWMLDP